MDDGLSFLAAIETDKLTTIDRAKALLWWVGRTDRLLGMSTAEICEIIEGSGHPAQNKSRLDGALASDNHVTKVPKEKKWRLHPRGRFQLNDVYEVIAQVPRMPKASDTVLSRNLFTGSRGYIEKVVRQINASYDTGLYDCCAVMCRRLLETLIIEVYETESRASEIKSNDHFFMLAELVRKITSDPAFNISRNARKGLDEFKRLGDLSAHNRRFNAQKSDIDQIQHGLRVASEELLHLAKLI